ncbi:Phosphoinositide phosphatase SAC1 [Vitis vinifera]|uniref:Phosphoinositide phosphatase SAC1 n=1 Tax=Vitis vinifera TaxID=29760 RepID=A0A438D0Q3_VITVI|nr:Phosphoinositide phosphatase SAC1 [Vitis vinifera]
MQFYWEEEKESLEDLISESIWYLKRGVNDRGRVANDVETEQIVLDEEAGSRKGKMSSVVQMRGSIPLFWSQEASRFSPKPDIILQRYDPTYEATKLHFEDLAKRYGNPIIVLNLIKSAFRLDSPFTVEEISKTIFKLDRIRRWGLMALPLQCFKIVEIQILDAVLIANEIVDEKRRSGEEGVVFKIDFEKAYDHVSWDFLDHVLEKKGFSPRWRKWMRGCLSMVSYTVLVNGNAKGWVKASRGLRQDDSLSPFLFILVADVLSRMLLRAEERNSLEGFRVGRNRIRVSHLQFADDIIFFSNTREEEL